MPECPCCNGDAFVVYGGEQLPCPQCQQGSYEAAIREAPIYIDRDLTRWRRWQASCDLYGMEPPF